MTRPLFKTAVIAGFSVCVTISAANAASPVKAGSMDCTVDETDKTLFSTHLVLSCSYVDINGNNAGDYQAKIDRTGLKIGSEKTESIAWAVFTLGDPDSVTLDGTYIGATAGASAGAGLGANYLTGGFDGKISLQPLSLEGKSGIGFDLSGQKMEVKSVPAS